MTWARPTPFYHFRLFIAGDGPNPGLAQGNLHAFDERNMPGKQRTKSIDLLLRIEAAVRGDILVTPMLVRAGFSQVVNFIGRLVEPDKPRTILGLNLLSR